MEMEINSKGTSSKRQKPDVQTVFTQLGHEEQLVHNDTKEREQCKCCNSVMVGGSNSGMSTMLRGSKKIDQLVVREMIAKFLIAHGYPFNIVEDVKFRALHSYLNSSFQPICRNTCKADCLNVYKKMKETLKLRMEKLSGRVSLTCDMWTSCTTDCYLCLTAHFIDDDWKLHSKILNFRHLPPPHTEFVLFNTIHDLLREWGIEKKIFSITLDNKSNMDSMQQLLCSNLDQQGGLLSHGKYFHIRCAARILNLVVQNGLQVISKALKKVRESVKYVEGSKSSKIKFRECVIQSNLNYARGLWLDVATRWTSTYLMLEKFLYFREAFEKLKKLDGTYDDLPTPEDFIWLEKVSIFLKPFYEITTLFSGREYPTANLYFENVWQVQKNIQNILESDDPLMKLMLKRIDCKIFEFWNDYSIVVSFVAILDPRFKLDLLRYLLPKLGFEYECKLMDIHEEFKLLFKEYKNQSHILSRSFMPVANNDQSSRRKVPEEMSEFKNYGVGSVSDTAELDLYLAETREDYELQLDVLDWWKKNQFRYPILSVMAKDILSIQITTVASKSSFNMGDRFFNKWRNCLTPQNAEILVCTRNWLYEYDISTNSSDEDDQSFELGRNIEMYLN